MEGCDNKEDIVRNGTAHENPHPYIEAGTTLKALNRIAKRPSVEIRFQDLTYTVPDSSRKDGRREILSSVSGTFRSGELTGILGPSGAGKSTLMNILTGYATTKIKGNILINGYPRDMRVYQKISSYIMQEDLVQPYLSVQEAMEVAANLKLGSHLGRPDKLLVIKEVLETLGLTSCKDTRTDNLSGGQRKRLSVAQELVNNPPIIFLDEPTSGLDVVSTKQCISLLKLLVNQGRTIICTIHQPAASILSLFDNLYIITRGKCVYQGPFSHLVPFMEKSGLKCPSTHNPADFIMETVQSDEKNITNMLTLIANGRNREGSKCKSNEENYDESDMMHPLGTEIKIGIQFTTSFWTQFCIILKRMMMQKMRNKTALWIQLLYHVSCSAFLGSIYYDLGSSADTAITNFMFCLNVMVLFTYTYTMIPILLYPTELKYLKREYFNRWYGLNSYFAALVVSGIPIMVILGILALIIAYLMSGQLLEFDRFVLYCVMGLTTGFCAEGLGYAIASLYNQQNGAVIAPSLYIPLLAISIYGIGFGPTIERGMLIAMRCSFFRYSIAGLTTAILADRPPLKCDDLYCHYSDTKILLRDLGLEGTTFGVELLGLLGFTIFYRFLSYVVLRYKLLNETFFSFMPQIQMKK